MKEISLKAITLEIERVIEKNLRTELLKERRSQLKKELVAIERQLRLLAPRAATPPRPAPRKRPAKPEGPTRGLGPGHKSVRVMLIEAFKRTRRPMKTEELTATLKKRGYRFKRARPQKTVDNILRRHRKVFRKTAPNTFALIR